MCCQLLPMETMKSTNEDQLVTVPSFNLAFLKPVFAPHYQTDYKQALLWKQQYGTLVASSFAYVEPCALGFLACPELHKQLDG